MESLFKVLILYLVWALVMAALAARKNRSLLRWGLVGALFFLPGLLVLAGCSYLCPACKKPIATQEWKQRHCPRCGSIAKW